MNTFVFDVLGLMAENTPSDGKLDSTMQILLQLREEAKQRKDYETSDNIRKRLEASGFIIKDGKEDTSWSSI